MLFRLVICSTLWLASMGLSTLAHAADSARPNPATSLTEAQRKEVQEIVRQMLRDHPELVVEAIDALEAKEKQAKEDRARDILKSSRADVERDPGDFALGNLKGDVTVVEFFDYRCPWCKAMTDRVNDVVKSDGKVRLVLKELPILGPQSVFASRAAIAAIPQGKYIEFHEKLMANRGDFGEDAVMELARQSGLDVTKLQEDMKKPEVDAQLKKNRTLSDALAISGTPAFVIGNEILRGRATDADGLRKLIAKARAG